MGERIRWAYSPVILVEEEAQWVLPNNAFSVVGLHTTGDGTLYDPLIVVLRLGVFVSKKNGWS